MNNLLAGKRFLIVEDEMLVLMNTEDMLADLGCTSVSAAATVGEALALIDDQHFDAAMVDMNLDGDETGPVADALAARGVPFMFATGYGSRGRTDRHGDRPLLKKPFQIGGLADMLTGLLPAARST